MRDRDKILLMMTLLGLIYSAEVVCLYLALTGYTSGNGYWWAYLMAAAVLRMAYSFAEDVPVE